LVRHEPRAAGISRQHRYSLFVEVRALLSELRDLAKNLFRQPENAALQVPTLRVTLGAY
jgi:hypothetical protein